MLTNIQKNMLKICMVMLCAALQAADQDHVSSVLLNVRTEFDAGVEKQRAGNYVEALQHFNEVVSVSALPNINRALVLTRIGDIYRKGGNGIECDYTQALQNYEAALAIPEYKDAYQPDQLVKNRMCLFMKMGQIYQYGRAGVTRDYAMALENYYCALNAALLLENKLTPEAYATLYLQIGDALIGQNDYTQALNNYEKIGKIGNLSSEFYAEARTRIQAVNKKMNDAQVISSLLQTLPENRKRSKPLEFVLCTGNKSARVPERPTPSASRNDSVPPRPFKNGNSVNQLLCPQMSPQLGAVRNMPLIASAVASPVQAASSSQAVSNYTHDDDQTIEIDHRMHVKAIMSPMMHKQIHILQKLLNKYDKIK